MLMTWAHQGGAPWFLLFPLLWIGLAVFAIVTLRGGWRRSGHHSAEAVLGERFAKGEITSDEYRERLAVLRRRNG
jgi:putative membrane protein